MANSGRYNQTPEQRASLAGLVQSTVPFSLVQTSSSRPTTGKKMNNRAYHTQAPLRPIPRPRDKNGEIKRPSSLTMDKPELTSLPRDRSPSENVHVLRDGVFDSDSDSTPQHVSSMQPRKPTGAEWNPRGRSPIDSESDVVSFHEVLKQLDQQEE